MSTVGNGAFLSSCFRLALLCLLHLIETCLVTKANTNAPSVPEVHLLSADALGGGLANRKPQH